MLLTADIVCYQILKKNQPIAYLKQKNCPLLSAYFVRIPSLKISGCAPAAAGAVESTPAAVENFWVHPCCTLLIFRMFRRIE